MRRSDAVLLATYLGLVTSTMGFLQPFLSLYMDAGGLTRTEIGVCQGLGAALALLVQPVLGRWSDRLDARRPFVAASALLAMGSYLAFPYARGFGQFAVLAALGANGLVYLNAAGAVMIGRMVQARTGGAAYANLRVWGSIGYIVVSVISGALVGPRLAAGREGLEPVFRLGPFLFLVIAGLAFFLPDAKRLDASAKPGRAPMTANLRFFLISFGLYNLALYGATGFLPIYLKALGATGPWITWAFAGGVIIEVLVMRQSGRLSDKYGRRPLLAAAFVLLPIRLMLYVPATGPAWVVAVQALHGINFGIVGAVAVAFSNDLATDGSRGHAQSRLAVTQGLASAIGPLVFGIVAQQANLQWMFAMAGFVAAIAAWVLLSKVEDSHPEPHPLSKRLQWLSTPRVRKAP
ncbi:MFS transporter [bacterium]|nr:MAG: MFS transporter [bacterium]